MVVLWKVKNRKIHAIKRIYLLRETIFRYTHASSGIRLIESLRCCLFFSFFKNYSVYFTFLFCLDDVAELFFTAITSIYFNNYMQIELQTFT